MNTSTPNPRRTALLVDACALLGVIGLGTWLAWTGRFAMNPDGISYLDVADAYYSGAWSEAISGYWSPMYSWVLGPVLHLLRPSPYWEFPAVKLANLLILLGSFFCFRFFLNELLLGRRPDDCKAASVAFSNRSLRVAAYVVFAWVSLGVIGVTIATPDLLMSCFVYLACGLLLRIARGADGRLAHLALGAVCALGYLSKAIFLPLFFAFLAGSLFVGGRMRSRWMGALQAGCAFVLLAAPLVICLSASRERWTCGDAGRFNYDMFVNGVEVAYEHDIHQHPQVWGHASIARATYPAHYAPVLQTGAPEQVAFHADRQIRRWATNLVTVARLLLVQWAPIALVIALLAFRSDRKGVSRKELLGVAAVLLPCLAGVAAYATVLVLARYLAHFLAVIFLCLLALVRLRAGGYNKRLLKGASMVMVGGTALLMLTTCAGAFRRRAREHRHAAVARAVARSGIPAGNRVCVIGTGHRHYWARLAGVQIAAQIEDAGEFFSAARQQRLKVYDSLRRREVAAIVGTGVPEAVSREGWKPLENTSYRCLLLAPPSTAGRFPTRK